MWNRRHQSIKIYNFHFIIIIFIFLPFWYFLLLLFSLILSKNFLPNFLSTKSHRFAWVKRNTLFIQPFLSLLAISLSFTLCLISLFLRTKSLDFPSFQSDGSICYAKKNPSLFCSRSLGTHVTESLNPLLLPRRRRIGGGDLRCRSWSRVSPFSGGSKSRVSKTRSAISVSNWCFFSGAKLGSTRKMEDYAWVWWWPVETQSAHVACIC